MGTQQGKFEEETIEELEATTTLNRAEIYHAFKEFQELYNDYSRIAEERLQPLLLSDDYINTGVALPISVVCQNLPAIKENPFRLRICSIFSTGGKDMSFIEFLDMVSAFSPKNSTEQKIFHAFQIFDWDGDGVISREDLSEVLDAITDEKKINKKQKDIIITSVFEEVNKECKCDGLSTEDFHYAISRSPDFTSTFSFRL